MVGVSGLISPGARTSPNHEMSKGFPNSWTREIPGAQIYTTKDTKATQCTGPLPGSTSEPNMAHQVLVCSGVPAYLSIFNS